MGIRYSKLIQHFATENYARKSMERVENTAN